MEKGTSIPMRPGAELGEQEYDGYDEMIHDHARIRFGVEEDQSGLVHRGGCDDGGNEAAPSRSDGEGSVFEILRWIELQGQHRDTSNGDEGEVGKEDEDADIGDNGGHEKSGEGSTSPHTTSSADTQKSPSIGPQKDHGGYEGMVGRLVLQSPLKVSEEDSGTTVDAEGAVRDQVCSAWHDVNGAPVGFESVQSAAPAADEVGEGKGKEGQESLRWCSVVEASGSVMGAATEGLGGGRPASDFAEQTGPERMDVEVEQPSPQGRARPDEMGRARPDEMGRARPDEMGRARPDEVLSRLTSPEGGGGGRELSEGSTPSMDAGGGGAPLLTAEAGLAGGSGSAGSTPARGPWLDSPFVREQISPLQGRSARQAAADREPQAGRLPASTLRGNIDASPAETRGGELVMLRGMRGWASPSRSNMDDSQESVTPKELPSMLQSKWGNSPADEVGRRGTLHESRTVSGYGDDSMSATKGRNRSVHHGLMADVTPLRMELQRGMEKAAMELDQTVRRVLGAEAVKLREELGSFRQKKRAFEEQQKAALMVKQQQDLLAQQISMDKLPQALRDEMRATIMRATCELEQTVTRAMGTEASKLQEHVYSYQEKQGDFVQIAQMLEAQQAAFRLGMQKIIGVEDLEAIAGGGDKLKTGLDDLKEEFADVLQDDLEEDMSLLNDSISANLPVVGRKSSNVGNTASLTRHRSSDASGCGKTNRLAPDDWRVGGSFMGSNNGTASSFAKRIMTKSHQERTSFEFRRASIDSGCEGASPILQHKGMRASVSPVLGGRTPKSSAQRDLNTHDEWIASTAGKLASSLDVAPQKQPPESRANIASGRPRFEAIDRASAADWMTTIDDLEDDRTKKLFEKEFGSLRFWTRRRSPPKRSRSAPGSLVALLKTPKSADSRPSAIAGAAHRTPSAGILPSPSAPGAAKAESSDERIRCEVEVLTGGNDQPAEECGGESEFSRSSSWHSSGEKMRPDHDLKTRPDGDFCVTPAASFSIVGQELPTFVALLEEKVHMQPLVIKSPNSEIKSPLSQSSDVASPTWNRAGLGREPQAKLWEELPDIPLAEEVANELHKLKNVGITRSFLVKQTAQRDTRFSTCVANTFAPDCAVRLHERDFGHIVQGIDEHEDAQRRRRWRDTLPPRTLFCLTLAHKLRIYALRLIENPYFDQFIVATIVVNVVWMAVGEPESSGIARHGLNLEGFVVFESVFALEAGAKIVATGLFMHPMSYLRDRWNCVDLACLVMGLLDLFPATYVDNPGPIVRVVRLLRPSRIMIRTNKLLAEVAMLTRLLVTSFKMLTNVFGLLLFIFFTFGILGVQLFQGFFRGRCFSIESGEIQASQLGTICSAHAGMEICSQGFQCLLLYENPNFDIVSFDDIGSAMITIFQIMIQQAWSEIMYTAWDSYSFWTWPYFIVLNILGPMFAIQLFLVIVANRYADAKSKQAEIENLSIASALFEVRIGIVQAAGLPRTKNIMSDTEVEVDPYVVVTIGDKSKKTRIIRNTTSPEWNEYFRFPVCSKSTKATVTLQNWVPTGPHPVLAQFVVAVGTLDLNEDGTDRWYELHGAKGGAFDGMMRLRSQWRVMAGDSEDIEWSPLPDDSDDGEDDDIPLDEVVDEEVTVCGRAKKFVKDIAESSFFEKLTLLIICANVLCMAWDNDCTAGLDDGCSIFKQQLEIANIFFTFYFLIEAIIKITGTGLSKHFKDPSNIFDAILVVISLITLPLSMDTVVCFNRVGFESPKELQQHCQTSGELGDAAGMRAFRLLRVMRVVRLVKRFQSIQRQVKVITSTVSAVSSLMLLLAVFLLIFSIVGMRIFGSKSIDSLDSTDADRITFFRPGVYTRVLFPFESLPRTARFLRYVANHTDEEGDLQPYEMRLWGQEDAFWIAHAEDVGPGAWDALGQIIDEPVIVGIRPRNSFDSFYLAFLTVFQLLTTSDLGDAMYPALRGTNVGGVVYFVLLVVAGNFMIFNLFVAIIITGFCESKDQIFREKRENDAMIEADKLKKANSIAMSNSLRSTLQQKDQMRFTEKMLRWVKKNLFKVIVASTADELRKQALVIKAVSKESGGITNEELNDLPPLLRFAQSKYVSGVTMCMVVISCAYLALQRPAQGQDEMNVMTVLNIITNIYFIIEASMRIYATGVVYLRSNWNLLELLLAVVSFIDLVFSSIILTQGFDSASAKEAQFVKFVKILRSLRPLGVVSRFKSLKVVLAAISKAVKPVLSTMFIMLGIFVLFGIMAVELIGDNTWFCSDPFILSKDECTGIDGNGNLLEWRNRAGQYRWVGSATLSMFAVASQDNWQLYMYAAIDATSKTTGPYVDENPAMAIFFLAFMIVGSFFFVQLFVGVFIDTYQNVITDAKYKLVKISDTGTVYLARQDSVNSEGSSASALNMPEPQSKLRLIVYDIVTDKSFERLIACFIALSVVFMSIDTYQTSEALVTFLETADFFFVFIFLSEAIAKLYACFPKHYQSSRWNNLDFLIIMATVFGTCATLTGNIGIPSNVIKGVRILRVLRILKIARSFDGLGNLIRTLAKSLTSVVQLAFLLLLLFFIFGVVSVEVFGDLCLSNQEYTLTEGKIDRCELLFDKDLLDFHSSFENLGMAMLTLFRVCTNDNWSDIMAITSLELPLRPLGFDATVARARVELQDWVITGNRTALLAAQSLLSICQSSEELAALQDVITCTNKDEYGNCPSTCGAQAASAFIFCAFLTLSNFVLLNLVMAVLIQELHKAMLSEERRNMANRFAEKTVASMNVLSTVGEATSKWIQSGHNAPDTPEGVAEESNHEHGDVDASTHMGLSSKSHSAASSRASSRVSSRAQSPARSRSESPAPLDEEKNGKREHALFRNGSGFETDEDDSEERFDVRVCGAARPSATVSTISSRLAMSRPPPKVGYMLVSPAKAMTAVKWSSFKEFQEGQIQISRRGMPVKPFDSFRSDPGSVAESEDCEESVFSENNSLGDHALFDELDTIGAGMSLDFTLNRRLSMSGSIMTDRSPWQSPFSGLHKPRGMPSPMSMVQKNHKGPISLLRDLSGLGEAAEDEAITLDETGVWSATAQLAAESGGALQDMKVETSDSGSDETDSESEATNSCSEVSQRQSGSAVSASYHGRALSITRTETTTSDATGEGSNTEETRSSSAASSQTESSSATPRC